MSQRAHLKSILKTSLPAALDLASQPVMWLIEAVFIGRLSAAALGGVGFALQIVLVTSTLLLTFVMGATILVNRHLGSSNTWEANHILGQTVMAAFLSSLVIALLWFFGAPLMFMLIHEREVLNSVTGPVLSGADSGIQYLRTLAFFVPVIVVNFVSVGMIRGSGDTRISMAINLTMNSINVVLAPTLIYGLAFFPRLEVRGAAIALGISHTIGLMLTLAAFRTRRTVLFLSFRELTTPRWSSLKQLFKMGLPTTVEQLVWSGGQLIVTGFVAVLGITELALHQVLLRLQGVLSMFYLGFGMAAMTLMGQQMGARDHLVAERTGRMTHRSVLAFVSMILVLLIVFSEPILHLFVRRGDVVVADADVRLLFIVFALVQIPKALNNAISGSLRGAGDIQWIMWVTVVSVLTLELGLNWIVAFGLNLGLIGIWGVQGLDEVFKSFMNGRRFTRGHWKLIRF